MVPTNAMEATKGIVLDVSLVFKFNFHNILQPMYKYIHLKIRTLELKGISYGHMACKL